MMTTRLMAAALLLLFVFACSQEQGAEQAFNDGDYHRAFNLWMPRAREGDSEAQNRIGMMYYLGLGVEQDYKKASEWYRRAAKAGHPGAQRDLGLMYESGRLGKRDFERAYMWLYAAYQQGNKNSRAALDMISGQLSPNKVRLLKQEVKQYIINDIVDPEDDDY